VGEKAGPDCDLPKKAPVAARPNLVDGDRVVRMRPTFYDLRVPAFISPIGNRTKTGHRVGDRGPSVHPGGEHNEARVAPK